MAAKPAPKPAPIKPVTGHPLPTQDAGPKRLPPPAPAPQQPVTPPAPGTNPSNGTGGTIPGSAADLLQRTLTAWGLQSLLPHLQDYLKQGYDSNTINLALQDTKEWHARFAGNDLRREKGLSVLTPAQYIAAEEQYRNVMQSYGLPPGFYDSHDDFNNFIGNDVSPNEVQSRAQIAHDTYFNAPPEWRQMWTNYGFSHGDAIASILDPTVGTQVIQDRANQIQIGGTAKQAGFDVSQQRAQQFASHGTTLAQAQKAYSDLSQHFSTDQNIADRFHTQFGQTQEENDLLLGDGKAAQQRQTLYNNEKGLFEGTPGTTPGALGVSQAY